MKAKAAFYFLILCRQLDNFYPWKDIVGKKVSKLRFIAELRAFYGTLSSAAAGTPMGGGGGGGGGPALAPPAGGGGGGGGVPLAPGGGGGGGGGGIFQSERNRCQIFQVWHILVYLIF
jgi:hypothetical protein